MANAKMTFGQMAVLRSARDLDPATRKLVIKQIFGAVKQALGIPDKHKLKVEIDDVNNPLFAVLVRKKDNQPYAVYPTAGGGFSTKQPVPEQPRWFPVAGAHVVEMAVDQHSSFDQGKTATPVGISAVLDGKPAVVNNAGVHVQLPATAFADSVG